MAPPANPNLTVTQRASPGRVVVDLYVPVEVAGEHVSSVTIRAMTFRVERDWQRGKFTNTMALLMAMTGLKENVLEEFSSPDMARLMQILMVCLPDSIRTDVANNQWPMPMASTEEDPRASDPSTEELSPEAIERDFGRAKNMPENINPLAGDGIGLDLTEAPRQAAE